MRPATLTLAPPHRLDIDFATLLRAVTCLAAHDEERVRGEVERAFAADAIAFLSVRSSLCAFLQAVDWPKGSEILVSAMTIGDMPKLIEAHGFVPVAVDIDPKTMGPDLDDLVGRITPNTKAILVAHLFGARVNLHPIAAIAKQRGLLLLEDCAQAYVGPRWLGHAQSDVVMFSFGTLKTMTALGGALVRVRDAQLRARMRMIQSSWPVQTGYAAKIAKSAAFLLAQSPLIYGLIAHVLATLGTSIGDVLRKATRGFPAQHVDELRQLLQKRPCAPLLAFLYARLTSFDGARLDERARAGEELRARFLHRMPGAQAMARTHWLVPMTSRHGDDVRSALWRAGIDASGASNITAVGGDRARALVKEIVFVPAYPELGDEGLEDVCNAIEGVFAREAARVEVPC